MNKNIEKLLKYYNPLLIETGLVQLFIEKNKLPVNENLIIKELLSKEDEQITLIKTLLKNAFNSQNIYDFINVFELLIPDRDKRLNGAFFTPRNITKFITSQKIKSPYQKICDPSCGCGAFLITAALLISKKYNINMIDVIENNIYGVDIAEYSIRRAKILLSLMALKNGEDRKDIRFNLKVADSLTIEWRKLFPQVHSGFDVILGNPPYVKFQDLNKNLRESLYKNWKTLKTGNYNLYFAFFELGVKLMNPNGTLGYITPNNYFTSLSGITLRNYLSSNKLIEKIIDFNHLKLFEAQTYTCITFLNKRKKESILYEKVDDYDSLKMLPKLKYSRVSLANLNNRKWRLLKDSDQENIKKIENTGKRLGDIADIRVGIATCKDSVYFIDGKTLKDGYYHKMYNGKQYLIEKDITHPIAKISDFKDQNDLQNNFRRIIFPYKKTSGNVEIIKETELKMAYPCSHKYLLAAKAELSTRDKGEMEYPEWYAYARTQGLNFFGKKILTPTFSSEPRFLIEHNEDVLFCNGYAIYLDKQRDLFSSTEQKINLGILSKILNSRIMDYYIKKTSVSIEGGYPCYQKNFIELLGIPEFTNEEVRYLDTEDDKNKINSFLINKYAINI
ncbi:MAG: hypothetical protein A3A26_01925 [Candidatus Zambryskibacteria bacterium RIFCSPLOWO2_01_FULL_47_14]|uniref:site-specific DNA-methyltransferase (adenine-specific) n=1 Tax=Candidatus Zambryskibacteria bacterium RIFCSPLOWO2_01_FULL_47_14 TaxID=1802763 RepID=A0A1G2U759_9BACT|nr:MAG: hypothetical protein A3A26_01925 [Candidatus Zambryskibacteria bacterium RIFCSPLOWO2_01_FULL_47_14]